jgi:hypothetical protein
MPGFTLIAKCGCGFERVLSPGASFDHGYVIAYTANGRDLETVESEKAKRESLTVIEDPCLEAEERTFGAGPYGPYQCPSCGKHSLEMQQIGFWD